MQTSIRPIGFNFETLNISRYGAIFTASDIGGRGQSRARFIVNYFDDSQAVVFVIDSVDHYRLERAIKELQIVMNDVRMQGKPVLIFANKQDLPGAKSAEEMSSIIAKVVGESSAQRPWRCIECTGSTGEGLQTGFQWITDCIAGNIAFDAPNDSLDNNADTNLTSVVSSVDSTEELAHNPEDNATLKRFSVIQKGSNCPFAKSAKLWGGPDVDSTTALEDQAKKISPVLSEFIRKSKEGDRLDGFCIELTEPSAWCGGPKELGECVRNMLTSLSKLDPANEQMMQVNFVGSRGWRFRFAGVDFFVTTFAPCYPSSSPRYAFGSSHAFILLQPESSFARHNLPEDTAETNWEAPKTIRDKTRVAFKEAGRPYFIPNTTDYPPAEHIVKPIKDDGKAANIVRWWVKPLRTL